MDFELRKDVVFHNGKKFNADDVVSTFNHISRPDSGVLSRQAVDWMKTTEKLGDYKVRVHFKKPFPAVLEFLSGGLSILPAGIWQTAKKDAAGKPDYGTVSGEAPSGFRTMAAGSCTAISGYGNSPIPIRTRLPSTGTI